MRVVGNDPFDVIVRLRCKAQEVIASLLALALQGGFCIFTWSYRFHIGASDNMNRLSNPMPDTSVWRRHSFSSAVNEAAAHPGRC